MQYFIIHIIRSSHWCSINKSLFSATLHLFEAVFGNNTQDGIPYLLIDETAHRREIAGILWATGDHYGIVGFKLYRILADKMLAKSVINAKNDEDRQNLVHGMIGELTDIIAGSASSAIKQVTIEISPTVVIIGENH